VAGKANKMRIREGEAGLVKSQFCTSCAYIPVWSRPYPPRRKAGHQFPPLAKGGLGGVVAARPITRLSHTISFPVPVHPYREAGETFSMSKALASPPLPPFARGGKGSFARHVMPSRAIKTLDSRPSLPLSLYEHLTDRERGSCRTAYWQGSAGASPSHVVILLATVRTPDLATSPTERLTPDSRRRPVVSRAAGSGDPRRTANSAPPSLNACSN